MNIFSLEGFRGMLGCYYGTVIVVIHQDVTRNADKITFLKGYILRGCLKENTEQMSR